METTSQEANIPQKIIAIGGLNKSGKTLIARSLAKGGVVAFPPTEFSFFRNFSEDMYTKRGGFKENLDYFFNSCPKSKEWNLTRSHITQSGNSTRDLYIILLDSYRKNHMPDRPYVGDVTPFLEQHFYTFLRWFGEEKTRLIVPIRNPYLNYASYKKKNLNKNRTYLEKLLFIFCHSWAQSVAYGQLLSNKFPRSFTTVNLDDYLDNPKEHLDNLNNWIGLNGLKNKIQNTSDLPKPLDKSTSEELMNLLTNYEKNVISEMPCLNFLECTNYSSKPILIDFKDWPLKYKLKILSKSINLMTVGILIERNSFFEILKHYLLYQIYFFSSLVKKISCLLKKNRIRLLS